MLLISPKRAFNASNCAPISSLPSVLDSEWAQMLRVIRPQPVHYTWKTRSGPKPILQIIDAMVDRSSLAHSSHRIAYSRDIDRSEHWFDVSAGTRYSKVETHPPDVVRRNDGHGSDRHAHRSRRLHKRTRGDDNSI